jgi:hypothetical protein
MRLIDADNAINVFANKLFEIMKRTKIEPMTAIELQVCSETCYKIAKYEIDNIATVYNPEKIVEELERKKRTSVECLGERNGTGFNKVMDLAIDIVKRGGVE